MGTEQHLTSSGSLRSRPASGTVKHTKSLDKAATDSVLRGPLQPPHELQEHIAALQERYVQLEANARASHEQTQRSIKQNRQKWLALKQENKDLKGEMAKRGSTSVAELGSKASKAVDKTMEKLEREVHDLRRQYDKVLQEKKTVLSKLENLQDSLRELQKTAGVASKAAGIAAGAATAKEARAMRLLENRLDKALVKCNEATSIQATYVQVLDKLHAEGAGFGPHVRALEEAVRVAGLELAAAEQAHRGAQQARDHAKQELQVAQEQVAKDRAARDGILEQKRAAAATLSQTNQALLSHQFGTPAANSTPAPAAVQEVAGKANATKQACDWGQEPDGVELANADNAGTASLPGGTGASVLQPATISTLEEAVEALCEAAACPGCGPLVEKLLAQQETCRNLEGMQKAAAQQLADLEARVTTAREAVEAVRSGGGRPGGTQLLLDAAQAELKEATRRAEAAKAQHDQVLRVCVEVRCGVGHLASLVSPLPLPPGQLPVPLTDDDSVADVLAQCQQRLVAGAAFCKTLPKAAALLEGLWKAPIV